MTNTKLKKIVEDYVEAELADKTFEELLEEHDLTPSEVFFILFSAGLVNENILETVISVR